MIKGYDLKKLIILSLKCAIGCSAAIYIAETANLQFAASAGSVTLLTLLTTKLETLRLSLYRIVTFSAATLLAYIAFAHISNDWISYGIFIFFSVFLSYIFGLKATVSVNVVIGTHYLSTRTFDSAFIINELLLVAIGIIIAIVMNLFHDYKGARREIQKNIRFTEDRLRSILEDTAMYLASPASDSDKNVWDDIAVLGQQLRDFLITAYEYQNNTFRNHPQYYIDYFEMRREQCKIIHSLHCELNKLRSVPTYAHIVSEYILYLKNYVTEINYPHMQLIRLYQIIDKINNKPLPKTQSEFEAAAILYHIMMDLEEFLKSKQRFVDKLDNEQLCKYWNSDRKY